MNGGKIGDVFGNLNGSSVVDYFLAPNTFTQNILNFSVGKYIPWISDHCPGYPTIALDIRPLPWISDHCPGYQTIALDIRSLPYPHQYTFESWGTRSKPSP